jgi:hypothetical protein
MLFLLVLLSNTFQVLIIKKEILLLDALQKLHMYF